MDVYQKSLELHRALRGKIETKPRVEVTDAAALALAYTPGVAEPCREIAKNPDAAYEYTRKWNTVAVVSDGSAVLGLGNIGGLAGLPVMEGKALLFKAFGDVDAVPVVLSGQDADDIVRTVEMIAPSFGGINLEDIAAPRCFEVEERLKRSLDIPVFHDDQHGTAVVVLAAAMNALEVAGKKMESARAVVCGAGSAGIAIAKLLIASGIGSVTMVDRFGIVARGDERLNGAQKAMAEITNPEGRTGGVAEAVRGADLFIGVSAAKQLTAEMVRTMAERPIVFAMANPVPEITPDEAKAGGAFVVGTGRSDYPNQVNNVLAFPGIFKGALEVRARSISEGMKLAAARALAELARDNLSPDYVLPGAFDPRVGKAVAAAVADAARAEGLARI